MTTHGWNCMNGAVVQWYGNIVISKSNVHMLKSWSGFR